MLPEKIKLTKETLPIVKQFAEQLPGGFVLYQENETRDILFVNHQLLDIYECGTLEEFKELTGYVFDGMVHPDDFAGIQGSIDHQIDGEYGSFDHVEYRILTKTGKVRWIDDYGHFSHSEEYGDVFYVFLFDITDKRRAEKAESTFYYKMANDLLTPMNAVSSFVGLALTHKNEPELLEDYLKKAQQSSDHMVELINNLVDIHLTKERSEGDAPQNVSRSDKIRVLIADDNELNLMILETILEEAGFEVDVADDGDKAVEKVREHPEGYYDVVLMDIQMKKMNGYEATRLIRRISYGGIERLPVMALSANSRDEDRKASKESGMNEHLEKPYDPEKIIQTIYRYTGSEGSEDTQS